MHSWCSLGAAPFNLIHSTIAPRLSRHGLPALQPPKPVPLDQHLPAPTSCRHEALLPRPAGRSAGSGRRRRRGVPRWRRRHALRLQPGCEGLLRGVARALETARDGVEAHPGPAATCCAGRRNDRRVPPAALADDVPLLYRIPMFTGAGELWRGWSGRGWVEWGRPRRGLKACTRPACGCCRPPCGCCRRSTACAVHSQGGTTSHEWSTN